MSRNVYSDLFTLFSESICNRPFRKRTPDDIMKTIYQFCLLALISFGLISCGDSHASLADEALDHMDEAIEVLEKLADGGDVDEAVKSLNALAEKSADLEKRMEELGDPDEDTAKEIEEKMKERIESSTEKVQGIMGKLTTSGKISPELMKALSEVMPAG